MDLAYLFGWVALGIALDWAMYSRIVGSLGMPGFFGPNNGYTEFLFPRIIITVLGSIFVIVAASGPNTIIVFLIIGIGLFLISNFHAAYRYLSGEDVSE